MKSKTHIPIDGSVHQRIPVVDIDAHVGEQANLWVDRIEPKTDEPASGSGHRCLQRDRLRDR
jgi:hypothetical protein